MNVEPILHDILFVAHLSIALFSDEGRLEFAAKEDC